jgi:hypothetical protein
MDTILQVQQQHLQIQQQQVTTEADKQQPPKAFTPAQADMSRATGGAGGAGYQEVGDRMSVQPDVPTLERQREEIVGGGGYRSLEELDRERERRRQELYLEEKHLQRGQQQQQQSTGGDYKSLSDLDRQMERRRQELYLEEKQQPRALRGAMTADQIEILDEKDLPSAAPTSKEGGGGGGMIRSMMPSWSSTSSTTVGAPAPAKPTSDVDQRLQHAAKEMGEALVLKAGELKDSAISVTSSFSKKYSTYLPVRFSKAGGTGLTEWERYGKKMDAANRLLVKAERRTNEARNAPPSKAAELYLKANRSRQKALQKALSAQELAGKMKQSMEIKLHEIQRGLTMQRDIWELYGATRLRAQEHLDRAEALLREANATSDATRAAELRNDSIHIRKKAMRKAQKAQKLAEEIQRQSEMRVEELRQRSAGSGTALGSGGSSTTGTGLKAGMGSY